ncbi:uncharacterized protein DNG_06192 [Cephalotrichum gorgonifer]|uniref:Uncharacterized protein n=1 Tax=Cephalotrichum gorgonifer TaxID=2041049 RepID=A0AAE8SWD5_9PEZI|nr:uncharacterized protein DNG_06192 [Cephalotrichum gorgonifer]
MRARSPTPERRPRYRYVEEEEEEEYVRRSHSRCRTGGPSPCKCCPPLDPPPSAPLPKIHVVDRTTQDSSPHGRSFTVTLTPSTTPSDVLHSLAPPRSGCRVVVCCEDGGRYALDVRDDLVAAARYCWLEVVDR